MTLSPRTRGQALDAAHDEWANRSQDWTNYCQMFVRTCWGIPALFGSAFAQWEGADQEDKHVGGEPAAAPLGAALCYKGASPFGHIMIAARPFTNGVQGAWSNDLVRRGFIDKAGRQGPIRAWGHRYLGFLTAVNHYDLRLGEPDAHPVPKEPRRYIMVERAGDNVARSLATARRRGDHADVEVLDRELRRLRRIYARLERER